MRVGLVRLRPMSLEDADMLLSWARSPDASPYWYGRNRPLSRDDLLKDWGSLLSGDGREKGACFAIEVESRPVGMVSYSDTSFDLDDRPICADMDIVIGRGDDQGRGYGTDAMRVMLSHLFDELGFHRVQVQTFEFNSRMKHCLEKLGFTFEGRARENAHVDGRYVDGLCYSMLSREFERGA